LKMIYQCLATFLLGAGLVAGQSYSVSVVSRSTSPILSYIDKTSTYQQIFNPTWVEPSDGTGGKKGIIARTQNCDSVVGADSCTWCGGAQDKASILTFSEQVGDSFLSVDESSVVFGPSLDSDSWGTEDPRMLYNSADKLYYMFYTAYNGSSILLNLATTENPTVSTGWTKRGPVFPSVSNSKSAALLLRKEPPHYLIWGDHDIRIAKSDDPLSWPDIGEYLIQVRADNFDSQLVESGPPPMELSNGDYLFFYNSAQVGWPKDLTTAYHVGWAILDGTDPTVIKARSNEALMGPEQAWEQGVSPYPCNAPNVVFLEAAYALGDDKFQVYFGGSDSTIGSAIIQVKIA